MTDVFIGWKAKPCGKRLVKEWH